LTDFYTLPTPEPESPQAASSRAATIQTGSAFAPAIGKCYEVHFGKVQIGTQTGFGSARIKANGQSPSQWIDLDTNAPLDPRFGQYVVQGFKEIECSNNQAADTGA
jgi:hypothetical protein